MADGLDLGVADLLADCDQFGDQLAQTLALGDLGLGLREGLGRDGARARLAVDLAGEDPPGPVAAGSLLGARATGPAALGVALDERAGAQVAELGELREQILAALLERGVAERNGHRATSHAVSIHYLQHGRLCDYALQGLSTATTGKSQS